MLGFCWSSPPSLNLVRSLHNTQHKYFVWYVKYMGPSHPEAWVCLPRGTYPPPSNLFLLAPHFGPPSSLFPLATLCFIVCKKSNDVEGVARPELGPVEHGGRRRRILVAKDDSCRN